MRDLFGEKKRTGDKNYRKGSTIHLDSNSFSAFRDWAIEEAERATGIRPDWARRSDGKQFKALQRLHKQIQPTDRLQAAWRAYLQEDGSYYGGHPPALLLAHIDRFLEAGRRDKATPWDAERRVHETEADRAGDNAPDPYHARAEVYGQLVQSGKTRAEAREIASAQFPQLPPI